MWKDTLVAIGLMVGLMLMWTCGFAMGVQRGIIRTVCCPCGKPCCDTKGAPPVPPPQP